ncbi:hypothetical protein TWF718_008033 [Orbilia javanica]|uniref:BAH domain-containing protein n=1 Tax=Orbilia javanica TaxID=47235 RepID=A0AAN8MW83_9PEZI
MALKRKRTCSTTSLPELTKSVWDTGSTNRARSDLEVETQVFKIELNALERQRGKKKQTAGFELDLINKLTIRPAIWYGMMSFGRFTKAVEILRGDIIEVKRPAKGDDIPGQGKEWLARVLEVKGRENKDKVDVYVRVAWYYWPEDLPMGRLEYHGRQEVIESNHPDIIDVCTINGKADIQEWDEYDEDATFDGYYSRQQFDIVSKQLTRPREFCVCKQYYNPDTVIINCPGCNVWMHKDCIIADAIERHKNSSIVIKLEGDSTPDHDVVVVRKEEKKGRGRSKKTTPKPDQSIRGSLCEGKIRIEEIVRKSDDDSDSGLDTDTIIEEDIHCLNCGELVP